MLKDDFTDFDDDPEFDEAEEEWEFEFDCHMDRNGFCGAAGSEDCDFECLVMAEVIRKNAKRRTS